MGEGANPDRIRTVVERAKWSEPPRREVATALFNEHLDLAAIKLALGHKDPPAERSEFAPPALRPAEGARTQILPAPLIAPGPAALAAPEPCTPRRRIGAAAAIALALGGAALWAHGALDPSGWRDSTSIAPSAPARTAAPAPNPRSLSASTPAAGTRQVAQSNATLRSPAPEASMASQASSESAAAPAAPPDSAAGATRAAWADAAVDGPASEPPVVATAPPAAARSLTPPSTPLVGPALALPPTAFAARAPTADAPIRDGARASPPQREALAPPPPPQDPFVTPASGPAATLAPIEASIRLESAAAGVVRLTDVTLPDPPPVVFATAPDEVRRPVSIPASAGPSALPPMIAAPRVVVHYSAQGPAPDRAPIAVALEAIGVARVGWRVVPFAISTDNVRFFFDADRMLADQATAAVARVGVRAEARDFTHFKPPPSPGAIELWLTDATIPNQPSPVLD